MQEHAAEMQIRARKASGFEEVEDGWPDLKASASSILTNFLTIERVYDLLSYLGPKNPLPRQVTGVDTVWLLDNTAFRNKKTQKWEAEFVTAVFAQHPPSTVMDAVKVVAQKIGVDDTDPDYPGMAERILPFLQDIKPGTQVKVQHDGSHPLRLGPGGRSGISSDIKELPRADGGVMKATLAKVPRGANGMLEMQTFFAEPDGWGVISDIDDTIKITMTSDPIGILRSTFFETPTPCPGMPELYAYLYSLVKETSPFFYLSASPYNLYPFLRDFRQRHYPHGTIILRDASWMSVPGLLSSITLGTQDYKVERMKKIHTWLPKRKMILIGDSTQADPEAYGDIFRAFPGWVKIILIRKVTDIAGIGVDAKNEPERFEKAFKGVPRDRWHVFEEPEVCQKLLCDLVYPDKTSELFTQ